MKYLLLVCLALLVAQGCRQEMPHGIFVPSCHGCNEGTVDEFVAGTFDTQTLCEQQMEAAMRAAGPYVGVLDFPHDPQRKAAFITEVERVLIDQWDAAKRDCWQGRP